MKLRGSAFSLRPRAKIEGKYFTSKMRITSTIIFWLTTQNPNTRNLSQITKIRAYNFKLFKLSKMLNCFSLIEIECKNEMVSSPFL